VALVKAKLPIFNAGTLTPPMKFSKKASLVSFVSAPICSASPRASRMLCVKRKFLTGPSYLSIFDEERPVASHPCDDATKH
jgi:hypothetical protein